ncbi:MAG: TonB-dependent receptor [Verrucomicrobiales bacterium]|nr:TonB-dependent receptor [Verrucomicrobiales bacterium]
MALWPGRIQAVLLGVLSLLALSASGQEGGTVSGVVVSTWDGRPLPAVAVSVRGTTLATQTAADGRYQLRGVSPGDQSLRFSKPGFASAMVTDVRVLPGQTSIVNGNLRPEFYELEEYEVTAEEFTQQTEQILFERQSAQAFTDAIGAEQFSRYGSSDAAEIMTKVTGTTIVEGKFAVIRGLSDRYTLATLNGAEIPSADPYRKAAQLDLFQASMIDRVVVNKTFTPDQPGGFTGGAIDIITKSFPEKFQFSLSAGTAYNTQASLNDDFFSYPGGSLDWLAMDDGTRDLPSQLRTSTPLAPNQISDEIKVNFAPTRSRAPLDHDFNLSLGDTVQVAKKPLGYFVGISYDRKFRFYQDTDSGSYLSGSPGRLPPSKIFKDTRAIKETAWSGVVNLAYQPWENHELKFNFAYLQMAEDEARRRQGTDYLGNTAPTLDMSTLHWTERNLNSYQLRGTHDFPDMGGWELDWLAALANTSQGEPDLRYFNFYSYNNGDGAFGNQLGDTALPVPEIPSRYWRDLQEQNITFKLDPSVPFDVWDGLEGKVKVGGFFSVSERDLADEAFYYGPRPAFYLSDPRTFPNDFFTLPEFNQLEYGKYGAPNMAHGTLDVTAGYVMLELPLVERLRFVGGVRYELTDLNSQGRDSVTGTLRTSTINKADLLPAAGLIYEVITNMNVRASFSQTIARPTFREITPIRTYDPAGDFLLDGNPSLQMTHINNYDVRWEWFFRPGELIAVSGFYKELEGPIEKINRSATGDIVTYENRPGTSKLYGVELEFRKALDFVDDLLADLSVGGNFTYIQSAVPFTEAELRVRRNLDPSTGDTRPLYDQSPYIINVDLTYDNRRSGTTASVVFNMAGERIYFTVDGGPDVYEQPFPQLDFVFSQSLWKHWKVKLSAKNILDPPFKRTYTSDYDSAYLNAQYHKGRTFGISLSYDF